MTTGDRVRAVGVDGIPVHCLERGEGTPVLVLHGSGVDHRAMIDVVEPLFADRPGYRRVYVDLPGMGRTPAPDHLIDEAGVLAVVLGLIDRVVGEAPLLMVGQSYGAYLARAVADRLRGHVAGLALICPLGTEVMGDRADVPEHVVLHRSGDADGVLDGALADAAAGYLVVQTAETLTRFRDREGPGIALADQAALDRMGRTFASSEEPGGGPPITAPTLIVTGRQDSWVGYAAAFGWLAHYPRATYAVLDRAGHGLPHEQPELLAALMGDWLDRVEQHGETNASRS